MSVGQPQPELKARGARAARRDERRRWSPRRTAVRGWSVRGWSLWSQSAPVRSYVIGVDATAIALVVLTAQLVAVDRSDMLLFGGLAVGAVLHYELSKRIERIREVTAEGVSYVDLQSVWAFAGLLLLPPPLVAALIAITYTHMWFRVSKRIVVHRWVFSASTVVLASGAAGVVLYLLEPREYPGLPGGWAGVATVVAAAAVRWFVNYALVLGAILLSSPGATLRKVIGRPADQLTEAAALGLGYVAALVMVAQPAAVVVLMVPLLVMQHSLMISQLQHAASRDRTTGLLTAMYWHELARKELERAERLGTTAGLLMIDVDRFKDVNRRHGQATGDRVLKAVAASVQLELGGGDNLVARLAGEEFVALLPGVTDAELAAAADRACRRVRQLTVDLDGESGSVTVGGLSISIGATLYPDSASDLDGLLLTADNALFSAKDAGRDGFCVVAAGAAG